VIFRQITHDDLGCASYLIGDHAAGTAAVVDPRFEIEAYLDLARYLDVRIDHVLETHNHADHVSGHGRLAAATGARIHVHRLAEADYRHEPFEHGSELELGSLVVRSLHTPGHRPEHTAFALIDTTRGDEPWAVLTGDSLFVGDVARPDLAVDKEEGARGIFRSLQQLLALPPETEVWPGHIGGSLCGGPGMDMKVSSTIGYERRNNELLAEDEEDGFVRKALAGLPPQPPNFQAIVDLNRGELVTAGVEVLPLAPRQVEQKRADGAMLVDVRTDLQFDEAHIPDAVCITMLHQGFGTKLAWVADREQEIVLIGRDDEDGRAAARLATAVGIRRLGGFLHGGMTAWRSERRDVQHVQRLTVPELAARRAEVQVLDVRERSEWDRGHIPGSVHVPYHDIRNLPARLDPDRPVAVICGSGARSAVAASLLQAHGAREVIHIVDGGVPQWGRLGHPLEHERLDYERPPSGAAAIEA
jgi:glyoxylase-like metal-dependent hydrolase (beta-lactamase superfamily II)/rhodanese-related sulfurtransferase